MKAIILSAGQGRRLLPFTREIPKCLLPVDGGISILEVQLRTLAACGIRDVTVMVGFGAEMVEKCLATRVSNRISARTHYNPFFATTDNLVTCWLAMPEMNDDFLLINGDTLFEPEVVRRLLRAPYAPVTMAIDHKDEYDEDDMKVTVADGRLKAVSKTLEPSTVDGEAIGMIAFRKRGATAFASALDAAVRRPANHGSFYLAVVNSLASELRIETASVDGLWWAEIDSPENLAEVRADFQRGSRLDADRLSTAEDLANARTLASR